MLDDQGLEDSVWNRTLLSLSTFSSLKLYLALLYAEIEHYQKTCRPSDPLRDGPLSPYFDNNSEWVSRLHRFRDTFLHPSARRYPTELSFLNYQGSYRLAPETQRQIDEYLMRQKLKLFRICAEQLARLPERQKLACEVVFRFKNLERMELHHDSTGIDHVIDQLALLCQERDQRPEQLKELIEEMTSWSPSQQGAIEALTECMNQVCPSEPEQQFSIDAAAAQTPMYEAVVLPLLVMRYPGSYGPGRPAIHARQNVDLFRELLLTAAVLWNESVLTEWRSQSEGNITREALDTVFRTRVEKLREKVQAGLVAVEGLQRANEAIAPVRVGTAILYEPLRLYAQIVQDNPLASNSDLEEWTDATRFSNLGIYRNSVFHVADRPWEVDLTMVDGDFDLPKLYVGLSQFFGINLDSKVQTS